MILSSYCIDILSTHDHLSTDSKVVRYQPTVTQHSMTHEPCVMTCNFCNNITCHCPSNSCNLLSNVAGFLGTAATTVLNRVKDLIHNDSDPKP